MNFVIHFHQSENPHYDIMIGGDEYLETWQVSEEKYSSLLSGEVISAEKIQNHRAFYINYEGPISCDRGSVKAMDRGHCEELITTEFEKKFYLHGLEIKGILLLKKENNNWFISYITN